MSDFVKIKLPRDREFYGKIVDTAKLSDGLTILYVKGYVVGYDTFGEHWVVSEATGWKYKGQEKWEGLDQFWEVFKTKSKTKATKVAKFLAKMLDTKG